MWDDTELEQLTEELFSDKGKEIINNQNSNLIYLDEQFFIDRGANFKYFHGAAEIVHEIFNDQGYLAGGSVRRACMGEAPSDYDIFLKRDILSNSKVVEKMKRWDLKYESNFANTYFDRLGFTFQVVKFFGKYSEVFAQFDITAAQWAYDYSSKKVITTIPALIDSFSKKIVINKVNYPVANLGHILKYVSNGFTFCRGAQKEFLTQSREVPIENLEIKYID